MMMGGVYVMQGRPLCSASLPEDVMASLTIQPRAKQGDHKGRPEAEATHYWGHLNSIGREPIE